MVEGGVRGADRPVRGAQLDEEDQKHVGGVSVIVPTRNEQDNVIALLEQIALVRPMVVSEVLFVDDSDDATPNVIREAVQRAWPFAVRLIERPPGERAGGLSGAVVEGWRAAEQPWVCVLDGDLQHPPDLISTLYERGLDAGSDLVIATRFDPEAGEIALTRGRRTLSEVSSLAAKAMFPRRLRGVSDPMSGYFMLRRDAIDLGALRPTGFKILLEVILRTPGLQHSEAAYTFAPRHAGTSKASFREGCRYLKHLALLRLSATDGQREALSLAFRFGLVGITGILVNQVMLWLAVDKVGLAVGLGAIVATQFSTIWNFILADEWVFRSKRSGTWFGRFWRFAAFNNASLLLRVPMLALLVNRMGMYYLTANLVTLIVLFVLRYTFSFGVVWGKRPEADLGYRYDVAGIVTIASEVELRELQFFRVEPSTAPSDLVIGRGIVGGLRPRRGTTIDVTAGSVLYREQLGGLVSNFEVVLGDTIKITVSPFLARSPHVVYTNIVEALLRFVLVSRDHMLLHGATFELDGTGVALSARTDTGKTGTILRLLRERDAGFLSDDMVIISPDGVAYAFPKPFTISAHTLRAVDPSVLTTVERSKLAVQSRLHSKQGRAFGAWLAEHRLPIMGLNSFIQWVVPPPKYMATRLVPSCRILESTRVSELCIIERGSPGIEEVPLAGALRELIENTDDAYGFPPFSQFAPAIAIGGDGYLTLRAKEEDILSRAIKSMRVRRVSSDSFSWADMIPELLAAGDRVASNGLPDVIDLTDGVSEPARPDAAIRDHASSSSAPS